MTVTIARQSGDADLTPSAATLTFTPANWNTPRALSIKAGQDGDTVKGMSSFAIASPGVATKLLAATEKDDDAPAAAQVLRATADAYVRDGACAANNFGTLAELHVKKASSSSYNRQAYLKFDLATVTSLTTAKLRLYGSLRDLTQGSAQIAAYGAADTAWSESSLAWTAKPSTEPTSPLATANVSVGSGAWYEWDMTAYLKAQKAAGKNLATLVLKCPLTTDGRAVFASDEATFNRPELRIG